jgi:hypothetical protein
MPADEPEERPATPDDFHAPESFSWRRYLRRIVREMPAHVVLAFVLVAFLFFHGLTDHALRFFGLDPSALRLPAGPLGGLLGAAALLVILLREKLRKN